jgi:hypothetical protein
MDKKIKIEVHAPHPLACPGTFLVVRVEGGIVPRVGERLSVSQLESYLTMPDVLVTQTGVWHEKRNRS